MFVSKWLLTDLTKRGAAPYARIVLVPDRVWEKSEKMGERVMDSTRWISVEDFLNHFWMT